MKIIKNRNIKIILIAIFITFSLSLSLNLITDDALKLNNDMNVLLKILIKFEKSIQLDTFKTITIFGFSFFLLKERYEKNIKNSIFKIILALLFSAFTVFGYSYKQTSSWNLVFADSIQFLKSIIVMLGYYGVFKIIIDYVFDVLINKINYSESKNKVVNFIFEKHSFIIPFIIILACWIPYIIICYPGILMPDSSNQIRQFFGVQLDEINFTNSVNLIDENVKITNHHPVLHTVTLGLCIKLGSKLINDNFGIFLYTIIQTILLASALAYSINFMKKLKTNNYIRIVSLMIFSLLPIFPFYALEITKDVPFTSLFIFYMGELYNTVKKSNMSIKRMCLMTFVGVMVCLLRNNGFYTILLSLPFYAILNKKNRNKILISTVIVIIMYQAFLQIVLPSFKIPNTGVREMLSVPFQQTARYVKEYENEVTKKEKKVIDKVLEYDTIATRYSPERSDSVKNKYNKDATKEDLKKYFKVWIKQFFKHPTVYMQSFMNNYYGYLYLERDIVEYVVDGVIVNHDPRVNESNILEYSYNDNFINARRNFEESINITKNLPIISWFNSVALNSWILLAMLAYLLYKKEYKLIVYLLPSFSIFIVYFISPVNAYFRYALANIFGMPLILSIFLNIINKREKEKLNEK